MKSEGTKPKNADLISLSYIKDENKYCATFQISNMDAERRKRIVKRKNSSFVNRDCKIFVVGHKIYVIDYISAAEFEIYESIVELANKGIVPQRIDPIALEQELDVCTLEQDIDMAIDLLSKSTEELKERYSIEFTDIL